MAETDVAPHFPGDFRFNTGESKRFSTVDYVIFAAVLGISAGIGAFFAWKDRQKKGIDDFLLAGRNMSPFPVALSLLASFMSAITLLGTPAEMYNYTTMYWWIGAGYLLVIAGAAHLYIPVFYHLGVTSAYEYLERRFSRGVRTSASMTFVLQMILYMAIVLYAPSLALHSVTGFTLWGSVVSVGVVCTLYTAFGGMKAVLWTDSFQVIMMIVSLLAILIQASVIVGGWGPAWDSALRTNRVWFTEVNPAVRHSVWSLTIGAYFTWVAIFGVNQAMVQRAVTCPTLKKAQIAMWLNFPGLCLILYLCCFIGIFMSAFYEKCDPLAAKFVTDSNEILPMFVMDILGSLVGLPGLFVAGLFSGALSTISSGLNSISACVLEDVFRAYFKSTFKEGRARLISQVLALVFGIICLGMTYVASLLGNILQAALSLFGMIGGPLLGVFTLGMFFPWANKWGAYSGLFGSLIFMFWIGVGAAVVKPPQEKALTSTEYCNVTGLNLTSLTNSTSNVSGSSADSDPVYYLYTLSYMWYSATAVATCIALGLIVSFITGATKPTDLDARLICPLFDVLFPYLPERIRKPLRFGIVHEGKYDNRQSIYPEKSEKKSKDATNGHVLSESEKNDKDATNGHVLSESEKNDKDATNGHVLSESEKNDKDATNGYVPSRTSVSKKPESKANFAYRNSAFAESHGNIASTEV